MLCVSILWRLLYLGVKISVLISDFMYTGPLTVEIMTGRFIFNDLKDLKI